MDYFKCYECGAVFAEDEAKSEYTEYEYMGHSEREHYTCCPVCGGGYDEAFRCHRCGKMFFKSDLFEGVHLYCYHCAIEIAHENPYRAVSFVLSDGELTEGFLYSYDKGVEVDG